MDPKPYAVGPKPYTVGPKPYTVDPDPAVVDPKSLVVPQWTVTWQTLDCQTKRILNTEP